MHDAMRLRMTLADHARTADKLRIFHKLVKKQGLCMYGFLLFKVLHIA